MLRICLVGSLLAATVLAAPARAALAPVVPAAAPGIRLAATACGLGYHRDVSGFCVDSMDYSRRCPPGYFPISAPNGNGYRCIPTQWMNAPGWLGDFFR
ncbi:MAG: hypothetical protein ABSG83_00555 [Roseiarcus sp.]|jgi:hypothetical protein